MLYVRVVEDVGHDDKYTKVEGTVLNLLCHLIIYISRILVQCCLYILWWVNWEVTDLEQSRENNQMTLASCFSLSISSSTEERITPAFLLGGSVTWTISKSDLISTFNSSGVNFFMGFDFAFIMLGRVAYLGWFSLRSVLQEEKPQNLHINKGITIL